jgi:uncharacterized repeat protein (TIGR04138 family)
MRPAGLRRVWKYMAGQSEKTKTVLDVSRELGCYSVDAFEFLHQGLDFTVQRTHGPPAPGTSELLDWLSKHDCGPADIESLLATAKLPEVIMALVEHLGGVEEATRRLNRHVTGEDLCWGLRDLALKRWGLMASTVLYHWGIRTTMDFGRMVFALVDNGLLQKQPHDCITDFEKVYTFADALDGGYQVTIRSRGEAEAETE